MRFRVLAGVFVAGGCAIAILGFGCSAGGGGSKFNTGGGAGTGGDQNPTSGPAGTGGGIGIGSAAGAGTSSGGSDMVITPACSAKCSDFPSAPIMDGNVPANAAAMFGAPGAFTTSLCVNEPQLSAGTTPGALMPADWTRPRFRYTPANGENLFEIRISAASEANELVVYSVNNVWTLPATIWKGLGLMGDAIDQPITVTIRGLNTASPSTISGATGTFTIAPVTAGGSMVYWATTSSDVMPTTSKLVGFYVGDENTIDALTIPQVAQTGILDESGNQPRSGGQYGVGNGNVACIGCHRSTPDGDFVQFTDEWPWDSVFANIQKGQVGAVPSWLTPAAQRLTQQPWMGMSTTTPAHWTTGDRITLITYENRSQIGFNSTDPDTSGYSGQDKLAWFDLETTASIPWTQGQSSQMDTAIAAAQGTAWGLITLTGETAGCISPDWSHDGTKIAYTSATQTEDGRIGNNAETDIHIVPYNNKMGGTVTPLAGAATPGISEYYPSFSADDKFIAFNRAGNTQGFIYYRPDGEVNVIPAAGGTPTRLVANDPPACTGETSPGIINSWAKWSPTVLHDPVNGNTYYWIIFSSARKYPGAFVVPPDQYSPPDTRASQLYMTALVIDKGGQIHSFPAVYLWNQDPTTSNLTPAWNNFQIPPPPPVQ
jgi:hypothetical protein